MKAVTTLPLAILLVVSTTKNKYVDGFSTGQQLQGQQPHHSYHQGRTQFSNFRNLQPAIIPSASASSTSTTLLTKTTLLASSSSSSSGNENNNNNKNSNNDELVPETSFGAEVVPEGQRPVNEYLEMKRAPLFDWASNDVGLDGLMTRLAIVYGISFAVLYV
jgi:hypothetical protein